MDPLRTVVPFAGRILLALIFVLSGWTKIAGFSGMAAYMAQAGLPAVEVLLVLTIIIELAGGLLLLVGWKARWAGAAIFLFIVPATLVFHDFWSFEGPEMRSQMQHFMKNLAIMGGMLYVVAFGPGRWALGRDTRQ